MCVSTTVRTGANMGWDMILVPDACDCFDLPDGQGGNDSGGRGPAGPCRDSRLRILPHRLDRGADLAEGCGLSASISPKTSYIGRAFPMKTTTLPRPPRVGLVSLGCPKALVDSERIITKLRADGYQMSPDYAGADVVLVNTCGFLDSAKEESLEAIGEAIAENGRVVVTGCMGNEADVIRQRFPDVLAVTGPQQYEVIAAATGWEPLGLIPFFPEARLLPAEDALALDGTRPVKTGARIKIAVPLLPHIANFDDLDPLDAEPSVDLVRVRPGKALPGDADLIILPGSKATIADLAALRASGLRCRHRRASPPRRRGAWSLRRLSDARPRGA